MSDRLLPDPVRQRFTAACLTVVIMSAAGLNGCRDQQPPSPADPDVPHGYVDRLQVQADGRLYRFGPFVGYYFKPLREDLSRVAFVCFNEKRFYASDMPINALLYRGEGVLTELPNAAEAMPDEGGRIRPVFFDQAPQRWLVTRPEPRDRFLHFHSLYDAAGAAPRGYWLTHEAVAAFTYDMGGRVGPGSPLYHRVTTGPDQSFARIIEFDHGPSD